MQIWEESIWESAAFFEKMNDCYRDGDNYDPDGEANNYADDGNNNNGTIATAQPHCLPLIHW